MNRPITVLVIVVSSLAFAMTSCTITTDNTQGTEQTGTEYTSTYICPMHCEGSGADAAGSCPVCKMDYVLNEQQ